MKNKKRLRELVEKGKKTPLSNKELKEMIELLGPDRALDAFRQKQ